MKDKAASFLCLALIVVLGAFYSFTLLRSHLESPKVSTMYENDYIRKNLRNYNVNQTQIYIPGTAFDMTFERAWILSRDGWSIPESNGSGTVFSGKGSLVFGLYYVPDSLTMRADIAVSEPAVLKVKSGGTERVLKFPEKGHYLLETDLDHSDMTNDYNALNHVYLESDKSIIFYRLSLD